MMRIYYVNRYFLMFGGSQGLMTFVIKGSEYFHCNGAEQSGMIISESVYTKKEGKDENSC